MIKYTLSERNDSMKGYRISVIRHGLTEANEKGIYIGKTDLPLSDKGAAELAAKMDEFDYPAVHKVYSSPLRRCTETAEILFPYTDLCVVDDLRELDLGIFENKKVDELLENDDYKAWLSCRKRSSSSSPVLACSSGHRTSSCGGRWTWRARSASANSPSA